MFGYAFTKGMNSEGYSIPVAEEVISWQHPRSSENRITYCYFLQLQQWEV
jgi:hypothetical protein